MREPIQCARRKSFSWSLPAAAWGLLLLLLLSGCSGKKVRYQASYLDLFDTVIQISGFEKKEKDFDEKAAMAEEMLRRYHKLFDIYHNYEGINNLKTINDEAGKAPVLVDKEIIELLEFSRLMYEETDGRVNAAFGSVLFLWHRAREESQLNPERAYVPDKNDLLLAAEHVRFEDVIIDKEASTVFLKNPAMRLDTGAIAKGYAAEKVAQALYAAGGKEYMISLGGNVRVLEGKPSEGKEKEPWRVGIQNPDRESQKQTVAILAVTDLSLVTSGVYERFYSVGDERYHHIISPDSLFPENTFLSVSILTKDSGVADALSTAVFNMSLEEGLSYIEGREDTEAMWILPGGEEVFSSGFEKYLAN